MVSRIEKAILQIQQKDEAGLNYIYSQTYNFVYLRAKSILDEEEAIRQLMQEVYVAIYRNAKEITVENFYEWIGTQVYAIGCGKLRKRKEREAKLLEVTAQEREGKKTDEFEKKAEVIGQVLGQLPDLYQATMFAFYYDHLKIEAIASLMECTPGVILNRLNYVRKYVKRALENAQEEQKLKGDAEFSVNLVCFALRQWAVEHCLGIRSAQNVYHSICRELSLQGHGVMLDGKEFAGVKKTIVRYKADDHRVILEDIDSFRKKGLDKKKTYLFGGGFLLILFVAALVFAFANPEKKKPKDDPKKVESQKDEPDKVKPLELEDDKPKEEPSDTPAGTTDEPTDAPVDVPTDVPATDVPADTPAVEPAPQVEPTSEYIFPNSATTALTREEIRSRTKEELRYARNEIYARHGVIFGVDDLDNYFRGKSWYTPTMSLEDFFANVEMSMVEEENIILIREVESGM